MERVVHVELRGIERPVDDVRVVDRRADGIRRGSCGELRIKREESPPEICIVAPFVIRHPRNNLAGRMRIAVGPVETVLVRIRKLEHVIRRTAVVSGLMRPVPALAVLEARIRISIERTGHELLKIGGLKPRERIGALDHRARVLVLTEAVHVILGNDTERAHLLLAGIVRIVVGDKHVRQRRERLFPFRLGIDPVEIAPEGISHAADKESMLFVRIVAVLLGIVLPVYRRIRRECLSRRRDA